MGINVVNPIPLHFVEQHFRSFHLFISQKPWGNQRKRCGNVDCFCFNWNHQINSQVFTVVHGESQLIYHFIPPSMQNKIPKDRTATGCTPPRTPTAVKTVPPGLPEEEVPRLPRDERRGSSSWFIDGYGLLIKHGENVGKVPFEWDMIGNVSINGDVTGK